MVLLGGLGAAGKRILEEEGVMPLIPSSIICWVAEDCVRDEVDLRYGFALFG